MSVQRGDRVEIGQPIGVLLGQDNSAHIHMTGNQSNNQPEIWLCPMDFMVAEERDELLEPTQVWADRLYDGSKTPLCVTNKSKQARLTFSELSSTESEVQFSGSPDSGS